jgi:phosphoribosylformimino-5-aminoimidazole carboxamide ribotide isomerase
MFLVPTLDIAGGRAVHARGGERSRYGPVDSVLVPRHPGDALALGRAFRATLGADQCYLADLDAIEGGAVQRDLLREFAAPSLGFGPGLVVDAGADEVGSAGALQGLGASRVVVGLETLRSFDDLAAIVAVLGADQVVFSLDLRAGTPLLRRGLRLAHRAAGALELARRARGSGVGTILLLDLGRVGTERGVDLELVGALRRESDGEQLWVGGGVGSRRDLESLARAGCDGALVGTALHRGTVAAEDFLVWR